VVDICCQPLLVCRLRSQLPGAAQACLVDAFVPTARYVARECMRRSEELWLLLSYRITTLAPLAACSRPRKLDLRKCHTLGSSRWKARRAPSWCIRSPSLKAPVHELLNSTRHLIFRRQQQMLGFGYASSVQNQVAIAAAGAIPFPQLLVGHAGCVRAGRRTTT
jgi:hypothetical protein